MFLASRVHGNRARAVLRETVGKGPASPYTSEVGTSLAVYPTQKPLVCSHGEPSLHCSLNHNTLAKRRAVDLEGVATGLLDAHEGEIGLPLSMRVSSQA